MKYLGIDYGKKRVGIAVSDETGSLAFARTTLENDKNLLSNVLQICQEDKIDKIVLGESLDYAGQLNKIMSAILEFKRRLEKNGWEVVLEPEFLTSAEAERLQGKNVKIDASAAALILKSYLDKQVLK